VDPKVVQALAEMIGPSLALLIFGAVPISIVFMNKYFKLKSREMELDAELHGREMESRLRTMEARQGATESAITALANGLSIGRANTGQQRSLMESPPDESEQVRLLALQRNQQK
jgi:hypothetical protein